MKKNLFYLFALICSMSLFTACSNDDDNSWTEIPSVEIKGENATMTVNGQPTKGSIQLSALNAESGNLKLNNLINGLESVTIDVALVKKQDNSFDFSGEKTVSNAQTKSSVSAVTTTVKVKGNITLEGKATVDVATELAGGIAGNWFVADSTILAGEESGYMYVHNPLYFNWIAPGHYASEETLSSTMVAGLANFVVLPLLSDALHQVNFGSDGNITAKYYSGTEVSLEWIMNNLAQIIPFENKTWLNSPSDLAYWYMKGDKIYVVPNIGNIIAQVSKDSNKSRAGSIDFSTILETLKGMSGKDIKAMLSELLPKDFPLDLTKISDAEVEKVIGWLSTGIPLNYTVSDVKLENNKVVKSLRIYLTKETFDPFMPMLFPLLPQLDKMMQESAPDLYPMFISTTGLKSLADIELLWKDTNKFEIGIDLGDKTCR